MDNEKYGIELELLTDKFNKQMQKVKSEAKSVQKAFNPYDVSGITINGKREIEGFSKQISKMTGKKEDLANAIGLQRYIQKTQEATNTTKSLNNEIERSGYKKYDVGSIEQAINGYGRTSQKVQEVKQKTVELNKETKNFGKITNTSLSNGLDKMTSKIKRFGLALLSVRSIWSLVSRASSAYLAQDTELANKLQAAWVGLGAILAPIINFITTLILKLVSVINMVVKALTGVDLIAKATAKSMKGAAGSANSLKKALAGFDELNNLDSDAGGGAGGFGLGDAFANIDKDWRTTMDNIYNAIDKFKTNIIKKMKESVEGAKKVLKQSGFSDEFIDMYDFAAEGSISVMEGFIDSFKGILEIFDGILSGDKDRIIEGFKKLSLAIWQIITGLIQFVVGAIGAAVTGISDLVVKGAKWIYEKAIKPIGEWILQEQEKTKEKVRNALNSIGNFFTNLWEGIKTGASNAWSWITWQLQGTRENFRTFINTIGNWFSNLWSSILRGFASIWNKVADTANKVGGKLGMTTLPRINSYAVGTNYVPEDQLAFIHKGEAVVPKKYNNGSYQPVNNDETNYLLNQVINAINNIEINPYTTIKDVGKSALNYINNKSRQLGESVVV